MTRYHLVIENDAGDLVGQFDVGRGKRAHIRDNLPDDLSIKTERKIPDNADLGESLSKLSENTIEWDARLERF